MALAERTWERVGERKRDRARLIESAEYLNAWKYEIISHVQQDISLVRFAHL